MKHLLIPTAIFLALLMELALPVWIATPLPPRLLDVAFVLIAVLTTGPGTIWWGGVAGLLSDAVQGNTLGWGLVVNATLALIAVRCSVSQMRSVTSQLLMASGLLITRSIAVQLLSKAGTGWTERASFPTELASTILVMAAVLILVSTGSVVLRRDSPSMHHV